MLEGNRFGHLIPGNNVPGPITMTPPGPGPKQPSPPQLDKPGEAEGRELVNEARRMEIEEKRRQAERDATYGIAKVEERRAAGFLGRMLNSHSLFGEGGDIIRSPAMQQLYDITPENFANAYSSTPEQRAAKGYIEDFIRAKLRLESGAAIGKDELAREYPLYFPMPGDTPADLKRKKGQREQAIISMQAQAGAAAPDITVVGGERLGGGEILPATAGSMGVIPRLEGKLDLSGLGDSTVKEGQVPTTVDTSGNKPVLDAQGRPLLELEINNPLKPEDRTAAEKRAEAYRQKQDRTFGKVDPRETELIHGMGGTLSDEAAGVGTAISHLLTGQNPIEGYTTGRDAERLRIEDARSQLGGWGTALEIGGGFLSFNPEVAMAPATSVLATLTQGAKAGAAGGAVFGYGSGEGFSDSLEKAAIGSAAGGVLGAAVPAAGYVASRLARPRPQGDIDLATAARQENVRLRSPMFDDNARRIKAGKLEGTSGGAPVIQRAIQETTDDIERAASRVGGPGNIAIDNAVPGEQIQNAGRRFITRTKGVADRLYNRARSLAGPDAAVTPREGLNQLRRELMDLKQAESVNAGEIQFINDIGEDLTRGPLTVDAIRAVRQGIRGRINEKNLTATQAEARAHRILDALHQDINASLPSAAATAFRRADTYYRERMIHIDDILNRFIGNTQAGQTRLSGEQAFKQLKTMASPNGDGRRLAAMWRDMTPDEQADVAATIMQSIGRRDADGPFSIDLFVSQARTLSPSARRTIFGPSGAESIDRLVRLSRSLQAAQKEVNKTKSGSTVMRTMGGTLAAMLLGGGGGAATMGAGTGAMVAGGTLAGVLAKTGINNLSARALMSPRVSQWLVDISSANTPAQIQNMARRLGVIASREPALAAELTPIQQALSGPVRQPLAAADTETKQ